MGSNLNPAEAFFLVFIVTCVNLLKSHVWSNFVSERM